LVDDKVSDTVVYRVHSADWWTGLTDIYVGMTGGGGGAQTADLFTMRRSPLNVTRSTFLLLIGNIVLRNSLATVL
jgi:hypothetical protein